MCGIAGIVTSAAAVPSQELLAAMAETIAYRGPDASGFYRAPGVGFAHRRLTIIDLSEQARQPIANEDGSVQVVYNGEIYNYLELMQELLGHGHRFRSRSDSEVIAHAWEQYGAGCVERFAGMFAFGLWDARERRFFAARDRLGIKPFYYFYDGSTFVFASEIKALRVHPAVPAGPEPEAIEQYLLFSHGLDDRTWFRGVRELPPGCTLTLDRDGLKVARYWDVPTDVEPGGEPRRRVEELREALVASVRFHLRSDVPVGAHLSGGIDSSTVVSLAARELAQPLHTFSAAFEEGPEFDERRYIRVVAAASGTQHHEIVPGPGLLPEVLPRLVWHLDQPVIGPAILPMYFVSELVAQTGIKVVLGGQGADEAFAGYPPFFVGAARSLLAGMGNGAPMSELLRIPSYVVRGGALRRALDRARRRSGDSWLRLSDARARRLLQMWEPYTTRAADPLQSMSYAMLKTYLPGLLQQEDRMSMAWSVESRVPLLDHRIVELACRMPAWMRIRGGVSKWALREAGRGLVPDVILDRRDKKGYPTPTSRWFRGPLAAFLESRLAKRALLSEDFVSTAAVRTLLDEHRAGRADHGDALWKALNLEIWMEGVTASWPTPLALATTTRSC